MAFQADDGVTVGIEEEFLLLDEATGLPAPRSAEVLGRAQLTRGALHAELMQTQVEVASGVCRTLSEVGSQVCEARTALTATAAELGMRLAACGVPVIEGGAAAGSVGPRFAEIFERFGPVFSDYQVSGCHVHVGVGDRDTAVAVLNHVSPWLPTLLALSANSAVRYGRDHRQASLRVLEQARLPGFGLPPWFASAADHDRQVDRLVDLGVLVDDRMTFWLVRPSAHLPTVELRAADTVVEPWEAVLQVALSRALVRTALTELAAGREGPRLDPQVAAASVWAAARHGLTGPAIDPVRATPSTGRRRVGDLLDRVGPALEEMGDLAFTTAAVDVLVRAGSGADRQRAALRAGGVDRVVDCVVAGLEDPIAAVTRLGAAVST
ncbi:carboxylate-amine ligase [Actinokineospora spheciospongiae]|uniref:carboxylate-amine ligase n=1 Tax=Actinokineospora spheciospongiae TaxID=909613 RepID=UPI001F25DE1F|nr:YbdK family carboxylate-amine ligase [Actinokineospora spheciospongiae]